MALAKLTAPERRLLRWHYFEGRSLVEIGARLGLDRSTASRRVAAARDLLLDATTHAMERLLRNASAAAVRSAMAALRRSFDLGISLFGERG
jgi:DNA-binding transcriptional regulator LsrR (DeoR family)